MKKLLLVFLIGFALFSLGRRLDFQKSPAGQGCPFCSPAILDSQVFYRGDTVLALLTHKPVVPGHVLVIPKRHVERFEELNSAEVAEIGTTLIQVDAVVKKIFGNTGSDLLEKNGKEAGQTVPHVHVHYLPRSQTPNEFFFLLRFFFCPWLKPMTEEEKREAVATYSSVWAELFPDEVQGNRVDAIP